MVPALVTPVSPEATYPYYPREGTYADLLCWHLDFWGTREAGRTYAPGEPWNEYDFLEKAFGGNWREKTFSEGWKNWRGRKGAPEPVNAARIADALFGKNPDFKAWREDLDKARGRSSKEKNRRTRFWPDPPPIVVRTQNVPLPTAHFIGRDKECNAIAFSLSSGEVSSVLVQGGPGIGKTELTKAIAHHPDVVARFGNRRYYIPLENTTSATTMQDAIIQAIGCNSRDGFAAALNALHREQSLLILDNLETPWERADQEGVGQALAELCTVSGVSLLGSIRGLQLVDGVRWNPHRLDTLLSADAASLFASIAGHWVYDDPHFEDFMVALSGLPLAISLVAHRAHGCNSLLPLWKEWGRIGTQFAVNPRSKAGRLTSLYCSIELSLNPLRSPDADHPALRLFSLLGALPAGLARDDAEALMKDHAFIAAEQLFSSGIAIDDNGRIDLLPAIREHAQHYYPIDDQDSRLWVSHFLKIPRRYARSIRENRGKGVVSELIIELPNIEKSFRSDLIQTGGAISRYSLKALAESCQFGHLETSIFEEFLPTRLSSEPFHGDEVGEAYCLCAIAWFEVKNGNLAKALSNYEAALAIWRDIRMPEEEAPILARLADIALRIGQAAKAGELYSEALEQYTSINDNLGAARCHIGRGKISVIFEQYNTASSSFESARSMYVECEDLLGQAESAFQLGNVAILRRKFAISESLYEESLSLFRQAGDLLGEANSLRQLARIDLEAFDFEISSERYKQAQKIYRVINDETGQLFCQHGIDHAADF